MNYIKTHGLTLSPFSLGTVQLGMTYGLGKDAAKPSEETAFSILDQAMSLGVNNLDTANNYGDSQAVIGRWLSRRRQEGAPLPWVVTKIGPFDHGSPDRLRDDILRQTDACRAALGMETLDCLMVHDFEDYAKSPERVRQIFQELKDQKLCRYTAISAYSRHDYGLIAESGFDATQVPLNVFDWSQIESGGLEKLHQSGMMVFVRSVFLQGLVFHTPEDLDPRMDFCASYLQAYLELCQEFSLSPAVLALSFVLSIPGVTTAVMGCDNGQQVAANCALFEQTVQLTQQQLERLHAAFRNIDHRVTNPGLWFNHT